MAKQPRKKIETAVKERKERSYSDLAIGPFYTR